MIDFKTLADPKLIVILPEIVLSVFAMVVLIAGVFSEGKETKYSSNGYIAIIGVIFSFLSLVPLYGKNISAFNHMVVLDGYAFFFKAVTLIITALTVISSMNYTVKKGLELGEYYALILFAAVGMMLMSSSTNLIMVFIALEMMSVSIYCLAGFKRKDEKSVEGAIKYFILGAFSAAFLLFGMALVYGATGTFDLKQIYDFIKIYPEYRYNPMLIGGIALIATGFLFKISTVPFHMWTPDVYQGAPSPITGFMATGVKAAAFSAFLRVFITSFNYYHSDYSGIIAFFAVITMFGGNLVALAQTNIKRMLAYSSIAHAGYMLVGIVASTQLSNSAILFYLLGYAFMNIGAFSVLGAIGKNTLEDVRGIGLKYPFLGIAMCVFMFSMAGVPPAVGFLGKFYLFSAAVNAKLYGLTILAVINSAISAYYYLRVLVYFYFKGESDINVSYSMSNVFGLSLAIAGVLYLGILPSSIISYLQESIIHLM
jgi:NADH-quinone oxidoreductase subunit N